MKLSTNLKWLSAYAQSRIKPWPIPLNRLVTENLKGCNIINIKMRQYPLSYTSKTYEIKTATFENDKPEEFLTLMKNFKTAIDKTGTASAPRRINYLRNMLRGEALK